MFENQMHSAPIEALKTKVKILEKAQLSYKHYLQVLKPYFEAELISLKTIIEQSNALNSTKHATNTDEQSNEQEHIIQDRAALQQRMNFIENFGSMISITIAAVNLAIANQEMNIDVVLQFQENVQNSMKCFIAAYDALLKRHPNFLGHTSAFSFLAANKGELGKLKISYDMTQESVLKKLQNQFSA